MTTITATPKPHPDATMPQDQLRGAYSDLLNALAQFEPAALQRVALRLDLDALRATGGRPLEGTAGQLAATWLDFLGQPTSVATEEQLREAAGRLFTGTVGELLERRGPGWLFAHTPSGEYATPGDLPAMRVLVTPELHAGQLYARVVAVDADGGEHWISTPRVRA